MTVDNTSCTLINRTTREMAVQLLSIHTANLYAEVQRLNYYAVIWIQKGNGRYKADLSEYEFSDNTMLFFTPYQPFQFISIRKRFPAMAFCSIIFTSLLR
jgi:AraC family transcriptional activator of pobA